MSFIYLQKFLKAVFFSINSRVLDFSNHSNQSKKTNLSETTSRSLIQEDV